MMRPDYSRDTELERPQLSEAEKVEGWRLYVLVEAGCQAAIASRLASARDVDLHQIVSLLEAGCTPELAAQILL